MHSLHQEGRAQPITDLFWFVQYTAYLKACEDAGLVQEGTVIIADNIGTFASFDGVKTYLDYVEGGGMYQSQRIPCTLEYRDDTPDEMIMSTRVAVVASVVESGSELASTS